MKRTELKRKTPMSRSAVKSARTSEMTAKRGKPLKPRSQKVIDDLPRRALVRAEVLGRPGGCVLKRLDPEHRCYGSLTPHHVKKASSGGAYESANMVPLCAFGNGEVEDRPLWASALGLVER